MPEPFNGNLVVVVSLMNGDAYGGSEATQMPLSEKPHVVAQTAEALVWQLVNEYAASLES